MDRYKVPTYDPTKTRILAELRNDVEPKVSQKQAAKFFALKRSDTVSDWENGWSRPRKRHRKEFIVYLADILRLRSDYDEFRKVWEDIMHGEWDWDSLSSEELQAVFHGTYAPPPQDFSRLATLPPLRIPSQVPPRIPRFIGRDVELKQLLEDLQPGRVVTLTGPGGIGKTALAITALWKLAPRHGLPLRFPDGIIWHDFYTEPQAAIVLEQIVRTFGEEPHPTLAAAARRVLAGRKVLLFLDGVDNADNLQAVLAARGKQCAVLVTSRRREDAEAEWQIITPLPLDEAVELLKAWGGTRVMDDEEAARRICQLIGGLPLAVRLAGRYIAQTEQDAGQYLVWLEDTPLQALDHGERQHKSIPILLKKSFDRVSEAARQAAMVLGLLALAPFDRDVIAAALETSAGQAERLLGELVNYSLLDRPGQHYKVAHALVHTYARDELVPPADVVVRLAVYYTTLARSQDKLGLEGYRRLDGERAHMMSMLQTCVERESWKAALSLTWAVDGYLGVQGHSTERVAALQSGLAAARALGRRYDEAAFLSHLGITYNDMGQVERAIEYYEQALPIQREIGDRRGQGANLGNLGTAYHSLGQVERAIKYYEQALAVDRETGDRRGEGNQLAGLGNAYGDLGQVEQAIEYYEQALAIHRQIGDRRGEGNQLGNLGAVYADLGEPGRAIEFYEQVLAIFREIGDRRSESITLGNLGVAYRALGQVKRAIEYYEQALVIARQIGDRHQEGTCLGNLGNAYRALGQLEKAIEYREQALAIARQIGDRHGEGTLLGNMGITYQALGQVERAIEYYKQALDIARQTRNRRSEGAWLGNLGVAYRDLGELERAIEYYEQALAIAQKIGDRRSEERHLGNLGNIYYNRGIAHRNSGDLEQAIEYYNQALTIAQEIGNQHGEGSILSQLGSVYRDLGQVDQARQCLDRALVIYEEIQSPKAEEIQKMLAELTSTIH